MNEANRTESWLNAIENVAKERNVSLPPFVKQGMGSARSQDQVSGRFVTFKRRLVSEPQAQIDGVEWALWYEQDELPVQVAAFRESVRAKQENVAAALVILMDWLVGGWTPEEAKAAVGRHPRAQALDERPRHLFQGPSSSFS